MITQRRSGLWNKDPKEKYTIPKKKNKQTQNRITQSGLSDVYPKILNRNSPKKRKQNAKQNHKPQNKNTKWKKKFAIYESGIV